MDLGKSGISTYKCLKKESKLFLFDDKKLFINKYKHKEKNN